MSTARTGYSQRVGSAIGGNRDAGGGVFENLPLAAFGGVPAMSHFTDFLSASEASDWVASVVGTPAGNSAGVGNSALGIYGIASGTANNTGYSSVQLSTSGSASSGLCAPSANIGTDQFGRAIKRVIGFETRLSISNTAAADWYIGLATIDTSFMLAAGTLDVSGSNNMVGFHHLEAGTGIPILTANAAAGTAQIATGRGAAASALVSNQSYRFGIRITGNNQVQWFIDGVLVADTLITTAAFDGNMVPTFCIVGNGTTSRNLNVDYVAIAQTR